MIFFINNSRYSDYYSNSVPLSDYKVSDLTTPFMSDKYNFYITKKIYYPELTDYELFIQPYLTKIEDFFLDQFFLILWAVLIFLIIFSLCAHNHVAIKEFFVGFSVKYRRFLINIKYIIVFLQKIFDTSVDILNYSFEFLRSDEFRVMVYDIIENERISYKNYFIEQYQIFKAQENKLGYVGSLMYAEAFSFRFVVLSFFGSYIISNIIFGYVFFLPKYLILHKLIWIYSNINRPDWYLLERYYTEQQEILTDKVRERRSIIEYLGKVHRNIIADYWHIYSKNVKGDLSYWMELKKRERDAARAKMVADFLKQKELKKSGIRSTKLNNAIDEAIGNYVFNNPEAIPTSWLGSISSKNYEKWVKGMEKRVSDIYDSQRGKK